MEQQRAAQAQVAEEGAKRLAQHRDANLKDMDTIFDDVMVKGDGDMAKLRSIEQFQEALSQLREQVESYTEEHIATVLSHRALKTKEYEEFNMCAPFAKLKPMRPMPSDVLCLRAHRLRCMRSACSDHVFRPCVNAFVLEHVVVLDAIWDVASQCDRVRQGRSRIGKQGRDSAICCCGEGAA